MALALASDSTDFHTTPGGSFTSLWRCQNPTVPQKVDSTGIKAKEQREKKILGKRQNLTFY
jgi:hypothetical protein